jgi:ADP-heptose:LPS heptosyltransferase
MRGPKNILVVRTDRIGDVVLTLPIANIIKKHFPDSRVSFLIREYTKSLCENNLFINEIITLDEADGKTKIFSNIRKIKKKFDTAIVAYPTFRIALILFLAGIKTRIGSGYRWYSFLFNKKIYEHRKISEHHELEYNIRLLKAIGVEEEVSPSTVLFNLHSSPLSRQFVEKELSSRSVNVLNKLIIIHPGSGGSSIDLPPDHMKRLVYLMAQELDVEILITGSKTEKELCESLVVNEKTKNLSGLFDLPELIALIEKSDLMIANSTGPIHIAAALGKHVIGFYPKIISCSDKRWGPYTNNKKIFSPTIDCNNCTRKTCEELDCMRSINIDDVLKSVKLFLNN